MRVLLMFSLMFCAVSTGASSVRGGVVTYTDRDAYLSAFPDFQLIDFETLPDGSPSMFGTEITPEFNYSLQGVDFFAEVGNPFIAGNESSGFRLSAGPLDSSTGPPNWLIIEFAEPVRSLGFTFPGSTTLTLFNPTGDFLGTWVWGGSGEFFLGASAVTDSIGSVIINRGRDEQSIKDFYWHPIPEPTSLLLLASGGLLLARKRANKRIANRNVNAPLRLASSLIVGGSTLIAVFGHGRVEAQPLSQTAINLQHNTAWEINTWTETVNANPAVLPYLWVPLTEKGQIIRVATSTYDPLTGEHRRGGRYLGNLLDRARGLSKFRIR